MLDHKRDGATEQEPHSGGPTAAASDGCRGGGLPDRREPAPGVTCRPARAAGYSVLEMLLVVAAIVTLSALSFVQVRGTLADAQANGAYFTALSAMRQARQSALTDRRIYVLTFTAPSTVLTERVEQDGTRSVIQSLSLASNVQFRVEPGIPTSGSETPDGFGSGSLAIDFNGSNQVFFQPDGSARDTSGRLNNGVIYLARPGDLSSARAITLFGATGRIKGWRLSALAWHWM